MSRESFHAEMVEHGWELREVRGMMVYVKDAAAVPQPIDNSDLNTLYEQARRTTRRPRRWRRWRRAWYWLLRTVTLVGFLWRTR